MRICYEEKLKMIEEIQEKFNKLEIDSLNKIRFLDELVQKEVIIISPPIEDDIEDQNFQYVSLESNILKGGMSRKPGNIRLDIDNCLNIIISSSVSVASAISEQNIIIKIMGLLGVICSLNKDMKVKISADQASLLRGIYYNCDEKKQIEIQTCYKEINKIREYNGMGILNKVQYNKILDELCEIKCISIENGVICLREKIKIYY